MSPLDATNASFIMGFIVFVSPHGDTASQYGEGRIRPITTRWIAGQSEHSSLLKTISYVKIGERRGIEEQQ